MICTLQISRFLPEIFDFEQFSCAPVQDFSKKYILFGALFIYLFDFTLFFKFWSYFAALLIVLCNYVDVFWWSWYISRWTCQPAQPSPASPVCQVYGHSARSIRLLKNYRKLLRARSMFPCGNRCIAVFGPRTILLRRAVDFSLGDPHRFFDADWIHFDRSIDRRAQTRSKITTSSLYVSVWKSMHRGFRAANNFTTVRRWFHLRRLASIFRCRLDVFRSLDRSILSRIDVNTESIDLHVLIGRGSFDIPKRLQRCDWCRCLDWSRCSFTQERSKIRNYIRFNVCLCIE